MARPLVLGFAAGDVGGARAILPVARLASSRGHRVVAMRHGVLHAEGDEAWEWHDPSEFADPSFWTNGPAVLAYATSVKDEAASKAALAARDSGRAIVHVLDNWSSYSQRLSLADGRHCVPDKYCVMDELAAKQACRDGVPARIVSVTGHPGLAKLAEEMRRYSNAPCTQTPFVMFVSEPVMADSGSPGSANWRGYDEVLVSQLVASALTEIGGQIGLHDIHVAPHPREDRLAVEARWRSLLDAKPFRFQLIAPSEVRATINRAQAVIGMTSILLYEAWLSGVPAMSLQPGLCRTDLDALSHRDGLVFCKDASQSSYLIRKLLGDRTENTLGSSDELARHTHAPDRVLYIMAALTKLN